MLFLSPLGSVADSVIDFALLTDGPLDPPADVAADELTEAEEEDGAVGARDFCFEPEVSFPRKPFRPELAAVGSSIFSSGKGAGLDGTSSSNVDVEDPPERSALPVAEAGKKSREDVGEDGRELSVSRIGETGGDTLVGEWGVFPGGEGGGMGIERRVLSRPSVPVLPGRMIMMMMMV